MNILMDFAVNCLRTAETRFRSMSCIKADGEAREVRVVVQLVRSRIS